MAQPPASARASRIAWITMSLTFTMRVSHSTSESSLSHVTWGFTASMSGRTSASKRRRLPATATAAGSSSPCVMPRAVRAVDPRISTSTSMPSSPEDCKASHAVCRLVAAPSSFCATRVKPSSCAPSSFRSARPAAVSAVASCASKSVRPMPRLAIRSPSKMAQLVRTPQTVSLCPRRPSTPWSAVRIPSRDRLTSLRKPSPPKSFAISGPNARDWSAAARNWPFSRRSSADGPPSDGNG
mmetsp:Transcript_13423/g.42196  ORF Transcript_13423/g.42196 Transcript_13423/m.42196 type:complete len:240 (+) Transcript_13423:752-1471(+)